MNIGDYCASAVGSALRGTASGVSALSLGPWATLVPAGRPPPPTRASACDRIACVFSGHRVGTRNLSGDGGNTKSLPPGVGRAAPTGGWTSSGRNQQGRMCPGLEGLNLPVLPGARH